MITWMCCGSYGWSGNTRKSMCCGSCGWPTNTRNHMCGGSCGWSRNMRKRTWSGSCPGWFIVVVKCVPQNTPTSFPESWESPPLCSRPPALRLGPRKIPDEKLEDPPARERTPSPSRIPARGGPPPPTHSFRLHPIMGYPCLPRSGRALLRSLLAGPAPSAGLGPAMVSPCQPRAPWLVPTPPSPSLHLSIGPARVSSSSRKSNKDLSLAY